MTPMTPEEFAGKMEWIRRGGDIEVMHAEADELMAQMLVELGYGEGVAIFKAMERWYA